METTTVTKIPLRPSPGEVWFFINLNLVEDVPATYRLVQSLGYEPKLAYRETRDGTEVHLLLHYEKREMVEDSLWAEFEEHQYTLADAINTDAIHFMWGHTKAVAV